MQSGDINVKRSGQPDPKDGSAASIGGPLIQRPKDASINTRSETLKKDELSFAKVDVQALIAHFNKIENGTLNEAKANNTRGFLKKSLDSESAPVIIQEKEVNDSVSYPPANNPPAAKRIQWLPSSKNQENEGDQHQSEQESK